MPDSDTHFTLKDYVQILMLQCDFFLVLGLFYIFCICSCKCHIKMKKEEEKTNENNKKGSLYKRLLLQKTDVTLAAPLLTPPPMRYTWSVTPCVFCICSCKCHIK